MTEASEHGKGLKEAALGHPERIGPYHLLERIGEGGMGVVYVAEQTEPVRRRVALKLIKAGMDTREVIARFHSERQALALMNHPNIARILEAGATEGGRPFFVMEYVPGMPLLEYCDAQRLPLGQRLRLFVQICEAVQHAHQKGVIHRDLKPSNLLVKEEDGQPVPKVIDFGVAKAVAQRLSDLTVHTQLGGLIGTPEYISPEQARMTGLDVDTRADVYSLGAVLYELLTGSRPFDFLNPALGLAEVQAGILEQEPRSPSQRVTRGEHARDRAKARRSDVRQLARRLHHDLDWIVLKALEKDRNRRYASASELAADIEHYLEGRPVVAGPRSTRYRLARFVRRHRSLLALGSLAVALLIAGIIGTTLGLMRARKEAERARVQTDIAREVHSFLTQDLLSAVAPDQQGVEVTMRQVLDQAGQRIEGKFQAQPRVEAALRQTLGSTYHSLGVYDAAETHLRRALEIHDELQGPEHADTLQVTYILGTLHRLQGRYDEAETLLSRAASHRRDLRGEVSELERSAFRALATLYQVSGRHAESEAFYLETLREREERLGRNSLSTVGVMSELSILYQHSNRLAEAEGLQAHVYQVWYEQLGPEHPTTLNSAINLSALYLRLERYDEAETVLLEALGPMRRVMGEEHPRSLMMANNLGYCYVQQRRFAEAEPVLIENYTIKRRVLGATHPSVIEAVENLVDLYQGMDEAEKLRRYSTEFLRLTGQRARESGASARDLNRYARQLLTTAAVDLRDPAAALRFALAANEQTSHGDARMLETLALAYAGTGELDRALATAHRAVEANPDKTTAFHRQLEAAVARYQQLQIAG